MIALSLLKPTIEKTRQKILIKQAPFVVARKHYFQTLFIRQAFCIDCCYLDKKPSKCLLT